jgi:hypothetical protein
VKGFGCADESPLKLHGFYKLWKKEAPNLRQRKASRFGRCNDCAKYDLMMSDATSPGNRAHHTSTLFAVYIHTQHTLPGVRARIWLQKDEHLIAQYTERKAYYTNKETARRHPDEFVSIIIDGMDSNTLLIPKLQRHCKDIDEKNATKFALMGVKMVNGGKYQYTYLSSGRSQKNANGTFNALVACLVDLKERKGIMPRVLFLQLDNCPSENKSRAFYILIATLVGFGVFDTVNVNYLMVGHTHEDIDQLFSVLSRYLTGIDVWTPSQFLAVRREEGSEIVFEEIHCRPRIHFMGTQGDC